MMTGSPTSAIYPTLACNLDTNLLRASLPLLTAGNVQALEWSFDALFSYDTLPDWFDELLQAFASEGRLLGHGVFFSLFLGRWLPEQQAWLGQLKALATRYRFDHITEHFGFMTGADFHKGAPLSIPLTTATLAIGRDRLQRIQDAANCPVGLENLAFAYSLDEVKRQGDFLNQLLQPSNGFIILDLHNLYCQSQNFGLPLVDLLGLYPLDRVREMHISGGSWEASASEPGRQIRRDTHDEAVPNDVFSGMEQAIDRCPNLQYVVLEQLGSGLLSEPQQQRFRDDFLTMERIIQAKNRPNSGMPTHSFLPALPLALPETPPEDADLFAQQRQLATILETAGDVWHAQTLLAGSSLAHSAWEVEHWQPAMLETALAIAQKWRNGFGEVLG